MECFNGRVNVMSCAGEGLANYEVMPIPPPPNVMMIVSDILWGGGGGLILDLFCE